MYGGVILRISTSKYLTTLYLGETNNEIKIIIGLLHWKTLLVLLPIKINFNNPSRLASIGVHIVSWSDEYVHVQLFKKESRIIMIRWI